MDTVREWSVKLAHCAAPDEVDLAPAMAEAVAAGGARREELLRRSGGVQGGFGAVESVALLPAVFGALVHSAPLVLAALASGAGVLGGLTSAAKDAVEVRAALKSKPKDDDAPGNPYLPLKKAAQTLTREMQAAGVPAEQSEIVAYRVLMTLCEDPEGAGQFVRTLHGPPGAR